MLRHMLATKVSDPEPLLISRDAAAKLLGISRRTLERMIADGTVPSRVLRRRRLVPRAFLMAMVRGEN